MRITVASLFVLPVLMLGYFAFGPAAVGPVSGPSSAQAKMPTFRANDVTSVFHIAKNRNRNQVHYGIRLDAQCRPVGDAPLYVYWREYEKGPDVVSPLLRRERPAYGLASQEVEARDETGGRVQARLKAIPDRPLTIETFKNGDDGCGARAITEVAGQPVELDSVFVQLGSLWSVRHIELNGRMLETETPINEIITR